ncbi:MAG: YidC/Oxa1 family membrane protein insertase [Oscillospiraceae bacterium]|nr:YidC/Oxa1 family membrane protein insertase [Oscillospiraceae bacterium]
MSIWEILSWPFAKLMLWFYGLTGNYGVSIILFSLAVNLVVAPFMAKSKKSMMRSTRLQPRIQEIQRRHEGNPQKLQQEMQKLYQEEGISPMSGCLWSLLPMFLLIPLYAIIRMPITRMMLADSSVVDALKEFFAADIADLSARAKAYEQIVLTDLAHQNWDAVQSALGEKVKGLMDIDFGFLGMNLGEQPDWHTIFTGPWTWAAIGLFLIPFVSAGMSWLSMFVSQKNNPTTAQQNAQAESMSKSMTLMMPLMSIWICFSMPAAMGIYWIANSIFNMIRDFILTKIYKKQLDEEDALKLAARSERERELEEKREETERLRTEGKTVVNSNTSKKKLQAGEKQKADERRAAAVRDERAARRERLGVKEAEKPASQVGNRRYARGRAYVPDRYDDPEHAEEATLAAALESEGAASIDETVEESADLATETAESIGSPADEQE